MSFLLFNNQISILHFSIFMKISIDFLKRMEDLALNPLKASTLRNRIKRRIEFLNEHQGDLALIAHLQQNIDLLDSQIYRNRVNEIKNTMKNYSKSILTK